MPVIHIETLWKLEEVSTMALMGRGLTKAGYRTKTFDFSPPLGGSSIMMTASAVMMEDKTQIASMLGSAFKILELEGGTSSRISSVEVTVPSRMRTDPCHLPEGSCAENSNKGPWWIACEADGKHLTILLLRRVDEEYQQARDQMMATLGRVVDRCRVFEVTERLVDQTRNKPKPAIIRRLAAQIQKINEASLWT